MPKFSRVTVAAGGALLISFIAAPLAQALESNDPAGQPHITTRSQAMEQAKEQTRQRAAEARERVEQARRQAEQRRTELKDKTAARLTGTKLRVCQNREQTINRLLGRIGDRGQKQLELIDTVSARVQLYYAGKKLNAAGYAELLATANAAKATVQTAVDAVKTAQAEFKCDGTDPKGAASSFTDLMQARDEALRAYRDAVRNLLVAVSQAGGQP